MPPFFWSFWKPSFHKSTKTPFASFPHLFVAVFTSKGPKVGCCKNTISACVTKLCNAGGLTLRPPTSRYMHAVLANECVVCMITLCPSLSLALSVPLCVLLFSTCCHVLQMVCNARPSLGHFLFMSDVSVQNCHRVHISCTKLVPSLVHQELEVFGSAGILLLDIRHARAMAGSSAGTRLPFI